MKKIMTYLMAIILSLSVLPLQSYVSPKEKPTSTGVTKTPETTESAEAKTLLLRLNEIKAKDMSKLNSTEKKKLRKEVRSINRKLKDLSGGVYISVGTLIIILLLLILLT
jgi:hypothetical protein